MAKLENGKLLLEEDEHALLVEGKNYSIIDGGKGNFLLVEKKFEPKEEKTKENKEDKLSEEKKQIIDLIKKENLSNLVEGKFEQMLNEKQRKALLELVIEQKVFVFKLNPSYKKGVYRLKEREERKNGLEKNEKENEAQSKKEIIIPEKELHEYSIDVEGIQVIRNKVEAEMFCNEREKEIKEGIIKGLKSFDGNYYLIRENLLRQFLLRAQKSFETKNLQNIEELSKNIKSAKLVAKIVCEFLKEEGALVEKKRDNYFYVS